MSWATEVEREAQARDEAELMRKLDELRVWTGSAFDGPVTLAWHARHDIVLQTAGDWTTTLSVATVIPRPCVVSMSFLREGADIWLVAVGEPDSALAALRRLAENQAAAGRAG